jgi:hypothetical protein
MFKVLKFSKPLILGGRHAQFSRRFKSRETIKQAQNIFRAKNKINEYITICNYVLKNPSFATFTYSTPQHDMVNAILDWKNFTRRMKRIYPDVAFLRVPERHKSGAVHFHAVLFGLPPDMPCFMVKLGSYWKHACPPDRLCERHTRSLAHVWSHGFVDLNQVRRPEAVGVYISKYLTKGEPDWTLFGSHVYSPNSKMFEVIRKARKDGIYFRASSFKNPYLVDFVQEDLKDDISLRKSGSFETHWLGTAKYELYQISDVHRLNSPPLEEKQEAQSSDITGVLTDSEQSEVIHKSD